MIEADLARSRILDTSNPTTSSGLPIDLDQLEVLAGKNCYKEHLLPPRNSTKWIFVVSQSYIMAGQGHPGMLSCSININIIPSLYHISSFPRRTSPYPQIPMDHHQKYRHPLSHAHWHPDYRLYLSMLSACSRNSSASLFCLEVPIQQETHYSPCLFACAIMHMRTHDHTYW